MKPRRKPIKGETLFRKGEGYNSRIEIHPVVVTKVGRKYFFVSNAEGRYRTESEHHIDTWVCRSDGYESVWALFESVQEHADGVERRQLAYELNHRFSFSSLSLGKLRRIKAITEES